MLQAFVGDRHHAGGPGRGVVLRGRGDRPDDVQDVRAGPDEGLYRAACRGHAQGLLDARARGRRIGPGQRHPGGHQARDYLQQPPAGAGRARQEVVGDARRRREPALGQREGEAGADHGLDDVHRQLPRRAGDAQHVLEPRGARQLLRLRQAAGGDEDLHLVRRGQDVEVRQVVVERDPARVGQHLERARRVAAGELAQRVPDVHARVDLEQGHRLDRGDGLEVAERLVERALLEAQPAEQRVHQLSVRAVREGEDVQLLARRALELPACRREVAARQGVARVVDPRPRDVVGVAALLVQPLGLRGTPLRAVERPVALQHQDLDGEHQHQVARILDDALACLRRPLREHLPGLEAERVLRVVDRHDHSRERQVDARRLVQLVRPVQGRDRRRHAVEVEARLHAVLLDDQLRDAEQAQARMALHDGGRQQLHQGAHASHAVPDQQPDAAGLRQDARRELEPSALHRVRDGLVQRPARREVLGRARVQGGGASALVRALEHAAQQVAQQRMQARLERVRVDHHDRLHALEPFDVAGAVAAVAHRVGGSDGDRLQHRHVDQELHVLGAERGQHLRDQVVEHLVHRQAGESRAEHRIGAAGRHAQARELQHHRPPRRAGDHHIHRGVGQRGAQQFARLVIGEAQWIDVDQPQMALDLQRGERQVGRHAAADHALRPARQHQGEIAHERIHRRAGGQLVAVDEQHEGLRAFGERVAHLRDAHRGVDARHARLDPRLAEVFHENRRLAILQAAVEPRDPMFGAARQLRGDLRQHGGLAEARRRHDERQPRRARQGVEDALGQPLARDGFFEVDDGPELQLVDGGWHGRRDRKTRAEGRRGRYGTNGTQQAVGRRREDDAPA